MRRGKGSSIKSRSIPIPRKFPNALYWRARLAEEEGNPAMARAFYQKLSDRFRNYYYAEFGRQRLKSLPRAAPKAKTRKKTCTTRCSTTFLRCPTTGKITATDPPDDNLRVERARLLSNGGLSRYGGARIAGRRQPRGRNLGAARDGARLSGHRPLRSRHRDHEAHRRPTISPSTFPTCRAPTGKRFSPKPIGPICASIRCSTASIPTWSRR